MFLFAITKAPISKGFRSYNFKEISLNSFTVSIVTDDFFSKYFSTQTGFNIVESPLIPSSNFTDIIYSEVRYIEKNDTFDIYNSVLSGRPVYYQINSNGDFFCSTHISHLKRAGVSIEENYNVLPEFFVYRFIMPPQTLYKNIKQLPPGNLLNVNPTSDKCSIIEAEQYNPLAGRNDVEVDSLHEISGKTLELLHQSIGKLAPVKDKIAVLLSGGLDSSILFKLCLDKYDLSTSYSTGYPFENTNENIEKKYAMSAARAFGTKHIYHEVSEIDYFHGFIEAISVAEVPVHHLQSIMLYLLFKGGIPETKDIVLLGEGADSISGSSLHGKLFKSGRITCKILSNYPFYQSMKFASWITGKGSVFLETLKIGRKPAALSDPDNIVWSLGAYGSESWACEYFGVNKEDITKDRYENIKRYENESLLDILTVVGLFGEGYVSQSIWSKIGESQKKIAYYPFYNPELINYLFSLPWRLKLRQPKNILREVARKLEVPEFIITRSKSSFGLQVQGWSERGGIFEPLVALASKVFDLNQIMSMQSTDPKKAMTFWNILNYSIWKRICIDDEPTEVLLEELKKQFRDKAKL